MRRNSETHDICQFCEDFWGEDKSHSCTSDCTCATYVNQDYVGLHDKTIGLPAPRSLPMPPILEFAAWYNNLPITEQKRIALKVGDLFTKVLPKEDSVIKALFALLIDGVKKEEICETLSISEDIYYVYVERLREAVEDTD